MSDSGRFWVLGNNIKKHHKMSGLGRFWVLEHNIKENNFKKRDKMSVFGRFWVLENNKKTILKNTIKCQLRVYFEYQNTILKKTILNTSLECNN